MMRSFAPRSISVDIDSHSVDAIMTTAGVSDTGSTIGRHDMLPGIIAGMLGLDSLVEPQYEYTFGDLTASLSEVSHSVLAIIATVERDALFRGQRRWTEEMVEESIARLSHATANKESIRSLFIEEGATDVIKLSLQHDATGLSSFGTKLHRVIQLTCEAIWLCDLQNGSLSGSLARNMDRSLTADSVQCVLAAVDPQQVWFFFFMFGFLAKT